MNDSFDQGQPDAAPASLPPAAFTPASGPSASAAAPQPFGFSGSGSEYFRIWIVNLLLSVITLGIYSAWAKVRRLRYFYDNTSVAGSSFEYHGKPIAILKGRVIAVVLIALYNLSFNISPTLGLLAVLVIGVAAPWLIWRSLQFKLYNSSYRGIRFGFAGSAGGAYASFLLYPLLMLLTVNLLLPFVHQRIKRFQHNESRLGASHFSFHASVGSFYKTYLLGIGIWLAGVVVILVAFGGTLTALATSAPSWHVVWPVVAMVLAFYAWSMLSLPLFFTLLQNLVWNNTRLGEHRFSCNMRWVRVIFITVTNLIGIACTLGLFTPFAQVRLLRYRIESMQLLPAGDLDEFIAAAEPTGSATSEGMSDLLDFDLSL